MAFVLRAFENKVDGVYIGGCWPGECHYTTEGNYHALGMTLLLKKIMKEYIGLNPERVRLEWVSASEGIRFAEVMNSVTAKVKELGPLGKSEGIDEAVLKSRLETVKTLLPYIKLVERERLRINLNSEEEYKRFFASEEADRLISELIIDKLVINQIMVTLKEKSRTTGEIAEILGLTPSLVARHVNNSLKQGLVRFDESGERFAFA